jgi:hypothetical protein
MQIDQNGRGVGGSSSDYGGSDDGRSQTDFRRSDREMTKVLVRLSVWNWVPYLVIGSWATWEIYGRLA